MKRSFHYLLTFIVCLLLFGCGQDFNKDEANDESDGLLGEVQKDDEGREAELKEEKLFDFKFLNSAPETTGDNPIDDVIKIYFHETSYDDPYEAVAIDIESKEVYAKPSLSIRGVTGDFIVHSEHADEVYDILEKYKVSKWDTEYIVGDPDAYEDGYSWKLMMQFKDGTVKIYKGNNEVTKPDKFGEFTRELHEFAESELDS